MSVAEESGTPKSRGAGSGSPKASGGARAAGSYGRGRPASGGAGQDRRRSAAGGGARQAGRSAAADGPRQPARKPAGRSTPTPAADGVRWGTTRDQGRRGPSARASDGTRGTTRPAAGDGPRGTSRSSGSGEPPTSRTSASGEYRSSRTSASGECRSSRSPAGSERRSSRTSASGEPRSNRSPANREYRGRSRASDDGGFHPASRGTAGRGTASRSAPGEGSRDRTSPGGRPGRTTEGSFRRNTEAGSDFRGARRPADSGSRRPPDSGSRRPPNSGSRRPPDSGSRRPPDSGSRRPADSGSRRSAPGDARRSPRPAGERPSPRDGGRDRTSRPARSSARDDRPGDNRAREDRPGARGQARPGEAPVRGHATAHEPRPHVPDSVSAEQLEPEARAQLNSLPNDLADSVARYLVAADLDEDPDRGYAYAQAAKRLAAGIGVVREACGIAAYRTGRWAEALSELRAARRMTGRDDYLPIMADCERALGRLDRALAVVREAKITGLERATQIELRIVESGIRRDQGLPEAAVIALQGPELTSGRLRPWSARLFYAYADALLAAGRADEARDWFARAAEADSDGETDAADRLDELDGVEFEDLAEPDDGQELDADQA